MSLNAVKPSTMSYKNLLSFIACCVAFSAHTAEGRTKTAKFTISGGQTVECPVTDGGPLPAEKGPFKVDVAGLTTDRVDGDLVLKFVFGVTVQGTMELSRVRVQDVSGPDAVTLVDDKNPKIAKNQWSGYAKPVRLSASTTPWLFDGKPTIKVFQVTITSPDHSEIILYQPAWYSREAKTQLLKLLGKNG